MAVEEAMEVRGGGGGGQGSSARGRVRQDKR